MNDLKAFAAGIEVGLKLYEQKIVQCSRTEEAIFIDGELYYIQSGRERLAEMLDRICR